MGDKRVEAIGDDDDLSHVYLPNFKHQVWSHGGSTFKKNMTLDGHFSRPAETDPYVSKHRGSTFVIWHDFREQGRKSQAEALVDCTQTLVTFVFKSAAYADI